MKLNIFKKGVMLLATIAVAGSFTGCTDNFEGINTDPYGIEIGDIPLSTYFQEAQQSIYYNQSNGNWEYQLIQNLNADLYSGYLAIPTPFNGNNNNSLYYMVDGWNSWTLNYMLLHVMKPTENILNSTEAANYLAIAKVLRVAGMLKATDLYGPVPYSKAMKGGLAVDYDSQEEIYKAFLSELETAAAELTTFISNNPGDQSGRLGFDLMCGKQHTTWLHYANTLRMRIAMRMVKVEPALAKQHCEAAYASGVLADADPNIEVKDETMRNPLLVIARDYNDCGISANVESILKGYNDPRLAKMALPVGWKGDITPNGSTVPAGLTGEIHGIRNGLAFASKGEYTKFSIPAVATDGNDPKSSDYPLPIMKHAEAYFLRAEGALRGWNMGGTAKALYEEGIRVSFADYGVSADYANYIMGTTMAADYVDPYDAVNNIAAHNDVDVKYNTADSNEKNLQRIITQRWIANFPEGSDGWAMFRRTGYPKLFPNVENRSGGIIPNGEFIKRLPFCIDEINNNAAGVASGVAVLGGTDNMNTRLWWDTTDANF
ncbi:MAG: SusD/RagB family nutrient-binding outer membrane lipoprotein [Bacteroidaceae bacterium]|nr:SusD/RagB family nutrient-binding outer membrane lipoprotein [Bacteroidaceae bacterium]